MPMAKRASSRKAHFHKPSCSRTPKHHRLQPQEDVVPTYVYQQDTVTHNTTNKDHPSLRWVSGNFYGDASGGELTAVPQCRRVGVSVCSINDQGTLEYGAKFNLPGNAQTVRRGELYALVFLIDHIPECSDIEYVTDNHAVYTVFNQGPKKTLYTVNHDLYDHLYKALSNKAAQLSVRWVPSHLDTNPRKGVFTGVSNLGI